MKTKPENPSRTPCFIQDIFQYVSSHLFPEVYTSSEKRGLDLESNFHILFKTYCDRQIMEHQSLAKNQANYENEHPKKKTYENEQKLIKNLNEFSNGEEQELKDRATKRLADRRERTRRIEDQKAQTEIGGKENQTRRDEELFKQTQWRI